MDTVSWAIERAALPKRVVYRANSGHHHLLVDTELPPLDQPILNDFNHLHFGAGQTEKAGSRPAAFSLSSIFAGRDAT